MKNVFGNNLTVTLFGESHGAYIGAVLDGLAAGIKINYECIDRMLTQRRPVGKISTDRIEPDRYEIISGVFNGHTTGSPITVLIANSNVESCDYEKARNTPRPSHADYTAEIKYHGMQDYRGGGHFSGRVTAALVAVGAIVLSALVNKGVHIGTHISYLGGVSDRDFYSRYNDIDILSKKDFPVLDDGAAEKMKRYITECRECGDSVGGVLETAVVGVPAGIGEPWFDTLEGMLAHALFSIPAIKGVEFGLGFGFKDGRGSDLNDAFILNNGKIETATNNNGGINGGIANGMPIIFKCAVKPTPSIYKDQITVDMKKNEETTISLTGRHDPAIIHRARAVVDAVTALVIMDACITRFGTDWAREDL